jgi:4'-phosphopantetheinyl transferase EntD
MSADFHPSLQTAIDALSLPGILIGYREISSGDEHALMSEEVAAFATSVVAVRRASGAMRIVARQLLGQIGLAGCVLPKGSSGAPIWPNGVLGSLSHDSRHRGRSSWTGSRLPSAWSRC